MPYFSIKFLKIANRSVFTSPRHVILLAQSSHVFALMIYCLRVLTQCNVFGMDFQATE